MTEQEWLTATDAAPLIDFISTNVSAFPCPDMLPITAVTEPFRWWAGNSERRLRLFACACVNAVRRHFPFSYFTPFWNDVMDMACGLADNGISQQEASDKVQSLNDFACSKACYDDNFHGYASQTALLAQPFTLSGDLLGELWWQASPLVMARYAGVVRDIFGNPFRPVTIYPSWLTSDVLALATGIYEERAFDRMPILADALQDAGCESVDVLDHCRGPGKHVKGCWVVDSLFGKV